MKNIWTVFAVAAIALVAVPILALLAGGAENSISNGLSVGILFVLAAALALASWVGGKWYRRAMQELSSERPDSLIVLAETQSSAEHSGSRKILEFTTEGMTIFTQGQAGERYPWRGRPTVAVSLDENLQPMIRVSGHGLPDTTFTPLLRSSSRPLSYRKTESLGNEIRAATSEAARNSRDRKVIKPGDQEVDHRREGA